MTPTDSTEYVGVIGATHGVDGTVVLVDTVGLPVRLASGDTVYVGYARDFVRPLRVASFHSSPTRTTIRLVGLTSPEQVASLIDQAVYVPSANVAPSATERYRIGDLEGATVVREDGSTIGVIDDVWLLPANDVWVVRTVQGRSIPLPVIDDVIRHVDITNRVVTARLLDGLEELDSQASEADDA